MQGDKDSSPINWERQRLADRMRFLFWDRRYKQRFAARAAAEGIFFSSPNGPRSWLLPAATAAAMLPLMVWMGAQLHEARMSNQAMAADIDALRHRIDQGQLPHPQPQTARPPEIRIVRESVSEAPLQRLYEVQRARADLERANASLSDLGEQFRQAREQVDSLRREVEDSRTLETRLSGQLRESELQVNNMTAELSRLQAGHSADLEVIATQKLSLRDFADRLNEATDNMTRERKMLVADRDIRELMGARSLHIVDVFDIDTKGQTQRPFGRIFFTEGKSLVFYAFDLKSGGTFQAWGQREAREESAQSLGLFYVDDQKQKRWVLKFDNPKVLAEINTVFVTVEPPGGSVKPNHQKMLYAYLNAAPNHP